MWPWEHAALGYVLYSVLARLRGKRVSGGAAVAVVFFTQLPDLVDKPLGWILHVTATGFAVGHSIFVAVPVGLLLTIVAWRRDRREVGFAAVLGWWSHLAGDVLVAALDGRSYAFKRVLWPVDPAPATAIEGGIVERISRYAAASIGELTSGGSLLLFLYVAPFLCALALWLLDGAPGVRELHRTLTEPE